MSKTDCEKGHDRRELGAGGERWRREREREREMKEKETGWGDE